MANNCYFELRAKGSREGLARLVNAFTKVFPTEDKIHRVYDFILNDTITTVEDRCVVEGYGDCAWSVEGCLIHPPQQYTSLIQLSKEENLIIEVVSEEPGIGFAEHYIIDGGEFIVNESRDYSEIYLPDADVKYFNSITKFNFTEEQFQLFRQSCKDDWFSIGNYSLTI